MCGSFKYTSYSVITPSQTAASAAPRQGKSARLHKTPEAGDQDSGQSDHESALERHHVSRDSIEVHAYPGT